MAAYKPTSDDFKGIETKKPGENFFNNARQYGEDALIGYADFGRPFANIPSRVVKPFSEDLSKKLHVERADTSRHESNVDKNIQKVFEILPMLLGPKANLVGKTGRVIESIPKVGKYLKAAAAEAIPQSILGGIQNEEDPLTGAAVGGGLGAGFGALMHLGKTAKPAVRKTVKTLTALAAGAAGHEVAKDIGASGPYQDTAAILAAALGGRGFKSKRKIGRELSEGVNLNEAQPRLDAAKRLGLSYLTPAEASLNPYVGAKQGALGKTPEGSKLLYEKGQQRIESEKSAIQGVLDHVYNEETHAPKVKQHYEKAYPAEVPTEVSDKYKDNKIISRAERMVKGRPAYQEELKNIPQDSLGYWDLVKRSLDDMIQKAPDSEARILSKTRKQLVSDLDAISPDYKKGRNLYERQFVRKDLEKAFDKKDMTGMNFYKVLASDSDFNKMMHSLRNSPLAQSKLKDMKLLFKDLIGTPTIRTASALEKTNMTKERNAGNFAENFMKHVFTGGKNDKAAIEFITSPNWDKKLNEIDKISDKQGKAIKFMEMLSRGLTQYSAKKA